MEVPYDKKTINRTQQEAVLTTFLWCNDVAIDSADAFILDKNTFDSDLRQIVELVNDCTQTEDRYYSVLNLKIEGHFPNQWLRLSLQTPLPFSLAKKIYAGIAGKNNAEMLKGV